MTRPAGLARPTALIAVAMVWTIAPALGCEQIIGIHDLDAGSGAFTGFDASASGSSSGSPDFTGSSSGGADGGGSGSGSSSGSSSGSAHPSSSSSGSSSGSSSSGGSGGTVITGAACNLSSDTHWTATTYLVQCDLQVDATLTIDPGAVVKFDTGHSMTVSQSGTLTASGTAAAPIVFTSIRDSAHGGSTGGTASAAPADWKGINLSGSGSKFDHCAFYYGGASDWGVGVSVGSSGIRFTVTNSIFAHNKGPTDSPFATPALDAGSAAAGTIIQNNIFYDNLIPLRISQNFSLDDSNSFDNSAAAPMSPEPNKYNGVEFLPDNCNNPIVSNISWSVTKVPFVIGNPTYDYLCVTSAGQFTLGPKVILKFYSGGKLTVDATSTFTTGNGDTFTSIKDDANGGDTNADGSMNPPTPGDWKGMDLSASGSVLDHCGFYYAGGSDSPALELNASRVTVTHSIFAHNQGPTDNVAAVPALDAASAAAGTVIQNNLFYDNFIPLRIGPNFSLDDTNSFDNSSAAPNSPQPNKYNGIDFVPDNCNAPIVSNISWSTTKVPFIIGDPSYHAVCVNSGGQFTLGANVTLKFFPTGKLTVSGTGTLMTDSTDVFTSIKDNSHPAAGGATDPGSTAPASGDWSGVVVNGTCETWSNILYSTAGCP